MIADPEKDRQMRSKLRTFREFMEEVVLETSYERDLKSHEPRIVSGVKGMKSKPFSKKFRDQPHMEKWMDSEDYGDHEVHHIGRA